MAYTVTKRLPRLPLDGRLDLTYRCNNICQHCWLWLPPDAPQGREELSFDEIICIVDEARRMGCQAWGISGGEPMLRPDFAEIFDYITRKSRHYGLNTNGTLITPAIARLMTRSGRKMVALYGATAEVHDRVTRNPGSFEAALRGFAYLKEAGASFIVQVIPMRANYHQFAEMLALAQSLSPHYRVGSDWLFLSADGSPARNRQIRQQRLPPSEVIRLDEPQPGRELVATFEKDQATFEAACGRCTAGDDRLFALCIANRNEFHIDPYGQMSFCGFIKDPALRYDLRRGSFRQAWEEFIPSLADRVHGGQEYLENCGACDLRQDCRWCAVYGYLEHGRFSARVEYLCEVARENRRFKEAWKMNHLRYYQIGDMTIQVSADFEFSEDTFQPKFEKFRVMGPGRDTVALELASGVPSLAQFRLGKQVYRRPPWAIYRQAGSWIYAGISPGGNDQELHSLALFNDDHTHGTIYRKGEDYQMGGIHSLTTFPTDQILLSRLLADRQGCILHAAGIVMDGQGLLFVGHSSAGKSTMLKMLRQQGEILCDDRIIVRDLPGQETQAAGLYIYGTWSHGELPDVSPMRAPLRAIFYLEQAPDNVLIPLADTQQRLGRLLSHVIKPLVTADWWEKTLSLAGKIASETPTYILRFDKSGQVVGVIQDFLTSSAM